MILAEDSPVATLPNATPRYRYHEEAPEAVSLPARELVEYLPGDIRRRGATMEGKEGRLVEIPCADLFGGKIPRVALGRLQELLPDLVQIPGERDASERIALPPGWIALHFRMETRMEELPAEEGAVALQEDQAGNDIKGIDNKDLAEVEAMLVKAEKPPLDTPPLVGTDEESSPPASPVAPAASVMTKEPETEPAPRKSLFASLPIFRRRHAAEAPAVESAEPITAERTKKKGEPPAPHAPGESPAAAESYPVKGSKTLAVERLWKLDPREKLADPSALQALFMTEEKLTLESVISKAGQLPGLNACVLAHGDQVLCTSNATPGVDLRTLSAQAMTMLAQIRETSANMGIGSVPAVTLHAEQGALSFLHKGELCLLVLHADRGFVPGVRERLQQMLGLLAEAKPALPPSMAGSGSESPR